MPAKLGPRELNRPDRRDMAAENRVQVMLLCARSGILKEMEDAAHPHVIACLIAGRKLST